MFTLNWTYCDYNLPSYFDICEFFFAWAWEGSFKNTAQFVTIFRASRKQMHHCLANVNINKMSRSITIF